MSARCGYFSGETMEFEVNEYGVPQYPRSDARKLLVLLAAIDLLEKPTLVTLTRFTGQNKGTINADVERLREQFGVQIDKDGAVYSIRSWGEVLKKGGVKKCLRG